MRQIVLDTETTGLDSQEGHRIIEIGCVEMVNRRITDRYYHQFLQPDRQIEAAASRVHGITHEFLRDKPRFANVVTELMAFIQGAELIIHNASFDVGFINHELQLLQQNWQPLSHYCSITDTLTLARERHPGQKNSLDALCKRYNVDNSNRQLHGALLDARLLAEVYLAMTGGQVSLLACQETNQVNNEAAIKRVHSERSPLKVVIPTSMELQAHEQKLVVIEKMSGGKCLWQALEQS
jgi:DNA polymerase III subunit epsilon